MMLLLDFAVASVNRSVGKKNHGNPIITRQLQSLVPVRELTSIETRQTVELAIGWIDILGFARPVI